MPSPTTIDYGYYIPLATSSTSNKAERSSSPQAGIAQQLAGAALSAARFIGSYFVSSTAPKEQSSQEQATNEKAKVTFANAQQASAQTSTAEAQTHSVEPLHQTENLTKEEREALAILQEHAETKHQKIAFSIASIIILTTSGITGVSIMPVALSVALSVATHSFVTKLINSNNLIAKGIGAIALYYMLNPLAKPIPVATMVGTNYLLLPAINRLLSAGEKPTVTAISFVNSLFHSSTLHTRVHSQCTYTSFKAGSLIAASLLINLAHLPGGKTAPLAIDGNSANNNATLPTPPATTFNSSNTFTRIDLSVAVAPNSSQLYGKYCLIGTDGKIAGCAPFQNFKNLSNPYNEFKFCAAAFKPLGIDAVPANFRAFQSIADFENFALPEADNPIIKNIQEENRELFIFAMKIDKRSNLTWHTSNSSTTFVSHLCPKSSSPLNQIETAACSSTPLEVDATYGSPQPDQIYLAGNRHVALRSGPAIHHSKEVAYEVPLTKIMCMTRQVIPNSEGVFFLDRFSLIVQPTMLQRWGQYCTYTPINAPGCIEQLPNYPMPHHFQNRSVFGNYQLCNFALSLEERYTNAPDNMTEVDWGHITLAQLQNLTLPEANQFQLANVSNPPLFFPVKVNGTLMEFINDSLRIPAHLCPHDNDTISFRPLGCDPKKLAEYFDIPEQHMKTLEKTRFLVIKEGPVIPANNTGAKNASAALLCMESPSSPPTAAPTNSTYKVTEKSQNSYIYAVLSITGTAAIIVLAFNAWNQSKTTCPTDSNQNNNTDRRQATNTSINTEANNNDTREDAAINSASIKANNASSSSLTGESAPLLQSDTVNTNASQLPRYGTINFDYSDIPPSYSPPRETLGAPIFIVGSSPETSAEEDNTDDNADDHNSNENTNVVSAGRFLHAHARLETNNTVGLKGDSNHYSAPARLHESNVQTNDEANS